MTACLPRRDVLAVVLAAMAVPATPAAARGGHRVPPLRGDDTPRLPDHAAFWSRMPLPFTPAEAWHLLSSATQAEIGAAVIGMVLAQYVHGDGHDEADRFCDDTLREIAALRDMTATLTNVVRAMQMQPRSWYGPHLNNVGKFADWLGDQLDAQIDGTVKELRAREPADWIERDIRLAAIAEATISNGDPVQLAEFARELLAPAEAERARG